MGERGGGRGGGWVQRVEGKKDKRKGIKEGKKGEREEANRRNKAGEGKRKKKII